MRSFGDAVPLREIALNEQIQGPLCQKTKKVSTKSNVTPNKENKSLFKLRAVAKSTIELEKYESEESLTAATNSAVKTVRG